VKAFLFDLAPAPVPGPFFCVPDALDYLKLATTLGTSGGLRKPVRPVELLQAMRECLA
jgi:hypothetical protein